MDVPLSHLGEGVERRAGRAVKSGGESAVAGAIRVGDGKSEEASAATVDPRQRAVRDLFESTTAGRGRAVSPEPGR